MRDPETLQELLSGARVDEAVFWLRPDYRTGRLAGLGPDVRTARRRIAAAPATPEGN